MLTDRTRLTRRAVVIVGAVSLAIIWIRLAVLPSSDLLNHHEFGRRFVAGTFLYEGGLNYPYLPTWAAAHALLAPIPPWLVSAALFPAGLVALVVLMWMLNRLSRHALPVAETMPFWVAAAALALTARFIIRDLLDAGPNLMLTAVAWGALFAWTRGRAWGGAWLLATAIVLKLTAAAFLVALVARRQYGRAWRVALCTLVLLCLPALRMGVENYMHHLEYWATRVRVGITSSDANFGVLGPEPVRNLSLRAATGRLLVRTRSPQVRAASGWIATAAIVVLTTGITLALSRLRLHDDLEAIVAWASAGVLALLLSPITWRAHAVALLPGCYLLIRKWASDGRLHAPGIVGLSAVAVPSIFLARGIVGTTASTWSDQWSLTTAAMLCLVVGIAAWPSRPSA